MIFDQRNHTLVVGTVGVVEVGLIHQNHRLPRNLGDEFAHFVLRRDAGSGIVRVADVNKPLLRRGCHFVQVMAKTWRERDLCYLSAIDLRVIKDCFEGRIGSDEIAARRSGERVRAQLENLARAVTEQDLIAINAIEPGQRVNQQVVVFIGNGNGVENR